MLMIGVWIWFCIRAFYAVRFVGLSRLGLQFSALFGLCVLLRGSASGAMLMAVLPVFWPSVISTYLVTFAELSRQILLFAVPVFLGGALACLALRSLRPWAIAIAGTVTLLAIPPYAERLSQRAMCATAPALGIATFRRNTFFWSLVNAGEEFQFDIHAVATVGDRSYGWSYRGMGWYLIPKEAWGNVAGDIFDCGALAP